LLLAADGGPRALSPRAYATPLGLHPDLQPSTFTVHAGDRVLFALTACWRPATGLAATSGLRTAWTRCATLTSRRPRTGCSTGWPPTLAASSTTMSRCSW
jgi:hypothetical protein